MLLKDTSCCHKCKYGWYPSGMQKFLEDRPMCLYFHDTGKHRVNDEEHCETFVKETEDDRKNKYKETKERYSNAKSAVYY